MPDPQNRFAVNLGVRIHYLDTGPDADPTLTPIVFVPGALGTAEDYREEMDALAPRRCIAISLRGRGQSDLPAQGYGLVDHIRDIEAVIEASGVEDFCLMGFSMGVPFALGYAILHPTRIVGMILGDYPAEYKQLSAVWLEKTHQEFGSRVPYHLIQALQAESAEIPLWSDLPKIDAPVLVIRGDQEDSLLSPEDADEYVGSLAQAMMLVFPGSGHHLWEPDRNRYFGTIKSFLQGLDAQLQGEDETED